MWPMFGGTPPMQDQEQGFGGSTQMSDMQQPDPMQGPSPAQGGFDGPLMDYSTQGPFYGGDPYQGLGQGETFLDAEYHRLHGQEAQHKIEELDRAAKFRRAMSMLTEGFATITGRTDIAHFARQQMVQEDQARADQVQSQIFAHVGAQALQREQQARMEDTQKALDMLHKGVSSDLVQHGDEIYALNPDGTRRAALPAEQSAYLTAIHLGKAPPEHMGMDPAWASANKKKAEQEAAFPGEQKLANMREGVQTAGDLAREKNRLKLRTDPATVTAEAERERKLAEAKTDKPAKPYTLKEYVDFKNSLNKGEAKTTSEKKARADALKQHLLSLKADLVAKYKANPASVDLGTLNQLRSDLRSLGVQ